MSIKAIARKRDKVRKSKPSTLYVRTKTKWTQTSIFLVDWYNLHLLKKHWNQREKVSRGQAFHRLITEKLKSLGIDPMEPEDLLSEGGVRKHIGELPLKTPTVFDGEKNSSKWTGRLRSVPLYDTSEKSGVRIVSVPAPDTYKK